MLTLRTQKNQINRIFNILVKYYCSNVLVLDFSCINSRVRFPKIQFFECTPCAIDIIPGCETRLRNLRIAKRFGKLKS